MRDVTRFIDEPCPCGVTLRRIARIKGRRDEMVVMGAGNMHPEVFERILHDVDGLASNWQVAVRQEGVRDIVEFRLELTNGAPPARVEEQIRRNLASRYPEVWSNHLCGMYQLAFRFLASGTLGEGRKRKRLVDERQS
jgi:phenylacetate-coenzyme A ligase PaaK-like adenylate-forming protein